MTAFHVAPPVSVRVLCIGSERLPTSLLAAALACRSQVERVEWTAVLDEALAMASAADVVVLVPGDQVDGGVGWIRAMTAAHPGLRLVVGGVAQDEFLVVACIEAGATACVTHAQEMEQLMEAILTVQRDQGYLDPSLTPALLGRLATLQQSLIDPQTARQRLQRLTPREQEVLGMMTHGWSNAAIARRLHIAIGTVKNHVHNILQKLKATGRWEAAACLEVAGRSAEFEPTWPLPWDPASVGEELPLKATLLEEKRWS
jgi:DNA-binding NarL/FixJ family response regulator